MQLRSVTPPTPLRAPASRNTAASYLRWRWSLGRGCCRRLIRRRAFPCTALTLLRAHKIQPRVKRALLQPARIFSSLVCSLVFLGIRSSRPLRVEQRQHCGRGALICSWSRLGASMRWHGTRLCFAASCDLLTVCRINTYDGSITAGHTGIGAGVDSFLEYLLKAGVLLDDDALMRAHAEAADAVMEHMLIGPAGVHFEVSLSEVGCRWRWDLYAQVEKMARYVPNVPAGSPPAQESRSFLSRCFLARP